MTDPQMLAEFNRPAMPLPAGDNFACLRANHQIYVDKTAQVLDLALCVGGCFLLARPRSFGKSTLLSTIEELFVHGTEPYDGHPSYFEGLFIDGKWPEKPGAYTVARWDFSLLSTGTADSLKAGLQHEINLLSGRLNIQLNPEYADNFRWMLIDLLEKCADNRIVLLIDEYDAPLLQAGSAAETDLVRRVMLDFYSLIKLYSAKFRLIFLACMTRIKDPAFFSKGNFITDLSQQPLFAGICGFSTAELKQYFIDNLTCAAAARAGKPLSAVSSADIDGLAVKLEQWYGGHYFGSTADEAVLVPGSVISFFNDPLYRFEMYWRDAGAHYLSLLKRKLLSVDLLTLLQALTTGTELKVTRRALLSPQSLERMNVLVLLWQSGCLTLKKGAGIPVDVKEFITLCVPNKEAAAAIFWLVYELIFDAAEVRLRPFSLQSFSKSVRAGNIDNIRSILTALLSTAEAADLQLGREFLLAALAGFFLRFCGFEVRTTGLPECGMALRAESEALQSALILGFKYTDSIRPEDLDQALGRLALQLKNWQDRQSTKQYPQQLSLALVYSSGSRRIERIALAA